MKHDKPFEAVSHFRNISAPRKQPLAGSDNSRYPRTMEPSTNLSYSDHRRDRIGLTYIYPVISRRAGGVSVGINLNPNNACNWRCIYCQVPGLQRGTAPVIDVAALERELRDFLAELLHGDFMLREVPPEVRRINDIALSGNGEPTSSREFGNVIEAIGRAILDFSLVGRVKLVLITNGSLIDRPVVQRGLRQMAQWNGEVWFKFDSASDMDRRRTNHTRLSIEKIADNLALSASLCPTWIQTCLFEIDGQPSAGLEAYLNFLKAMANRGVRLNGVLLYGLARPSTQSEAPRLSPAPLSSLEEWAAAVRGLGLPVSAHP